MKQLHVYPPNWQKLVELYGAKWGRTVVTYGDTCYCAHPLSPDLEVHESVHARQQANPKEWWERYYTDAAFRFEQELEAYREQFKFFRRVIPDRNRLFKERDRLARDLAGPMYGKCVSYQEAYTRIGQ